MEFQDFLGCFVSVYKLQSWQRLDLDMLQRGKPCVITMASFPEIHQSLANNGRRIEERKLVLVGSSKFCCVLGLRLVSA